MGDKQQIGIIGGGAMAEAMIAGMTAEGAVPYLHIGA